MIDFIDVHVFCPRLINDYLRFDEFTWYIHDKISDSYNRIYDTEALERAFQQEKENGKSN
jgi:hypothetical protein